MATVYYIIRPKQILLDTLDEEVDWFYTKIHAWENDEFTGITSDTSKIKYRILEMKLMFMLHLMNYTKTDVTKSELYKILGNPLEFSVAMFDKWWDIERIGFYNSVSAVLRDDVTPAKLDLLKSEGYKSSIRNIMFERETLMIQINDNNAET